MVKPQSKVYRVRYPGGYEAVMTVRDDVIQRALDGSKDCQDNICIQFRQMTNCNYRVAWSNLQFDPILSNNLYRFKTRSRRR